MLTYTLSPILLGDGKLISSKPLEDEALPGPPLYTHTHTLTSTEPDELCHLTKFQK